MHNNTILQSFSTNTKVNTHQSLYYLVIDIEEKHILQKLYYLGINMKEEYILKKRKTYNICKIYKWDSFCGM